MSNIMICPWAIDEKCDIDCSHSEPREEIDKRIYKFARRDSEDKQPINYPRGL